MNGVDAVCMATGQDWRAVESAAHAFAAEGNLQQNYRPLTHY
jgi:hydroxymethylglutaryl-CoA reductase